MTMCGAHKTHVVYVSPHAPYTFPLSSQRPRCLCKDPLGKRMLLRGIVLMLVCLLNMCS